MIRDVLEGSRHKIQRIITNKNIRDCLLTKNLVIFLTYNCSRIEEGVFLNKKYINLKGYCYVVDSQWGSFSCNMTNSHGVIYFILDTLRLHYVNRSCGRFSYVPFVLCAWSSKPLEIKKLQAKMSLIGE